MANTHRLTALIEKEGNGYVALCPELDIASQSLTIEESQRTLKEALELFLREADTSEVEGRLHSDVYVTGSRLWLGRLRVLSGRAVCRILANHGFFEVRRHGSHIIMQLRKEDSTVTVPVPDHDELLVGTPRSVIRQSGLPRTLFETT